MNRQKLLKYLEHPTTVQPKHKAMLADMVEQYPYSAMLRALLAKSAGTSSPDYKPLLANAALYTPNRNCLKSFINGPQAALQPDTSYYQQPSNAPEIHVQSSPSAVEPDVEQLKTSIEQENTPAVTTYSAPIKEKITEEVEPSEHNTVELENTEETKEDSREQKADIFKELEDNLRKLREQREKLSPDFTERTEPTLISTQGYEDSNLQDPEASKDEYSADVGINISKGELSPALQAVVNEHPELSSDNDHIQHQRNLIKNFLNKPERISRPNLNAANTPVTDLSVTSANTPPDLVTETLANIMVRQGKLERAIDIYEKLILKYPQKSTYFAGRIEQLKNEL